MTIDDIWNIFVSDKAEQFFSIVCSVTTIFVGIRGCFLAKDWLASCNRKSAHDAANVFFDELINLPLVLMAFTMSASRCAAFMSIIEDEITLRLHNAEVQQKCLKLAESALEIKLRFFNSFSRANKRGVCVIQLEHVAIEQGLIQFGDELFKLFRDVSARLIKAENLNDYKIASKEFLMALQKTKELSDLLSEAIKPIVGTKFSEYFSFSETPSIYAGNTEQR